MLFASLLPMFRNLSARIKKTWAAVALLSAEVVVVGGLLVGAMLVFVVVVRRIFVEHKTGFDARAFAYLKEHVSTRNTEVLQFFTFFGSHVFLIPANLVLIAWFLFIKKRKWYSIKIPAIAISSLLLMMVLKHLFNRSRPDIPLLYEAKGLSFPSGHALMSVTFYGLMIYIIFKAVKNNTVKWSSITAFILLICMIGLSRVYLRVHYATDVIAGYCVGFLWLVFAVWVLNHIEKYSKRKLASVVETEPANPSRQ